MDICIYAPQMHKNPQSIQKNFQFARSIHGFCFNLDSSKIELPSPLGQKNFWSNTYPSKTMGYTPRKQPSTIVSSKNPPQDIPPRAHNHIFSSVSPFKDLPPGVHPQQRSRYIWSGSIESIDRPPLVIKGCPDWTPHFDGIIIEAAREREREREGVNAGAVARR